MDHDAEPRTTAGGPRKSDRLRARPMGAQRRRPVRPVARLARRRPRREVRSELWRRRRTTLVAALIAATAAIGSGEQGPPFAVLAIGGGLGVLATAVPLGALGPVARRLAQPDGPLVRAGLAVAPVAAGLAPGLALSPSIRWSLLALPALGLTFAAGGLWTGSRSGPWAWRASCGALLAWAAWGALRALPRVASPANATDIALGLIGIVGALAVGALGWGLAARLERGLVEADEAEQPEADAPRD